jgi:hypothetical protein
MKMKKKKKKKKKGHPLSSNNSSIQTVESIDRSDGSLEKKKE